MTSEAKPRLGRGLAAAGVSLACTFLLVYGPALIGSLRGPQQFLAVRVVSVLVVVLLVRVVLAPLLGVSVSDLGLATNGRTMLRGGLGVLVGAAVLTLAFCMAWGAGGLVVIGGSASSGAALVAMELTTFVVGALFEELTFRVGLVGVLRLVVPPPLAIGMSAAVFGLLHATNPGATTVAVTNTALAGVLLGLLFVERNGAPRMPSLGLCTGFHIGWNVMQNQVLGIPVSGFAGHSRALFVEAQDVAWSGGSYGLEAGWGATLALAAACLWAARRADLSTPLWAPSGS